MIWRRSASKFVEVKRQSGPVGHDNARYQWPPPAERPRMPELADGALDVAQGVPEPHVPDLAPQPGRHPAALLPALEQEWPVRFEHPLPAVDAEALALRRPFVGNLADAPETVPWDRLRGGCGRRGQAADAEAWASTGGRRAGRLTAPVVRLS